MPLRSVTIRLLSAGADAGPFLISDNFGNNLYDQITRESIMSPSGLTIDVPYETLSLTVTSYGTCNTQKTVTLSTVPPLITRYYELVPCDPQLPNVYTKIANTLPANQYVKAGMTPIFYVYQGAYVDQNFDPSNLDTSIVPTSGIGCP